MNKMGSKNEKDTPDRNLVCVLFPGIVKNDEKAIKCLGGLKAISQVYTQSSKKRLGLSYNPDNPYIRKIHGDCKNIPGILFKVKVKKSRVGNEVKREVISTTIVGRVEKTFRFDSVCDFQYLPIPDEPTASNECLIEKLLPTGTDTLDFFEKSPPLFLIPAHFSRTEKPTNYEYIERRYNTPKGSNEQDDESHNKIRADRRGPNINIIFDLVREFPKEPHEHYINIRDSSIFVNSVKKEQYEIVKKLFEERPIWSQNLIRFKTQVRTGLLKTILPCLAFYLNSGPWKKLWIRLGYDPRKDPEARKYQTLDFRFRCEAAIRSIILSRDDQLHYRRIGADRFKYSKRNPNETISEWEYVHESTVVVRPGLVPTQRQMYYQYIDVQLPEVQDKISEEPPPGMLCHETRGWLPPNTDKFCRRIIYDYSKKTIMALRDTDVKLEMEPQGSSGDEHSTSDEEAGPSAMEVD